MQRLNISDKSESDEPKKTEELKKPKELFKITEMAVKKLGRKMVKVREPESKVITVENPEEFEEFISEDELKAIEKPEEFEEFISRGELKAIRIKESRQLRRWGKFGLFEREILEHFDPEKEQAASRKEEPQVSDEWDIVDETVTTDDGHMKENDRVDVPVAGLTPRKK